LEEANYLFSRDPQESGFSLVFPWSNTMSTEEILLDVEERMEKAIRKLKNDLAGIRTGRANPGLVDSLKVEVYGSPVPIKQVASVGAPEPNQIIIRPYDPGTLKDIEKAIQASDLGFTPQNDGRVIRLNVPQLSTEVRRKMVGRVRELAEESKVAIRNIRRDGNKSADQAEKDKEFSEDDRDQTKEEIQDLTKQYEAQAADLAKAREKEVMDE
jgi:ribosome recycling factor